MNFFNKARSVLRQNLCNKHISIEGSASNLSVFQSIRHASNRPSRKPSQKLLRGDVIDAGEMTAETFYEALAAKVVKHREGNSKRSGFVTPKGFVTSKGFFTSKGFADLESKKVCIGSSLAEQNRMKRNLYHFKSLFLSKRRNENHNLPTRTRSSMVYNSSLYSNSIYCAAPSNQFNMKRKRRKKRSELPTHSLKVQFNMKRKRRKKRIELPTHSLEVNYRTQKAVMFYGPNIRLIPHNIKWKDMDMLTNEWLRKNGYVGYTRQVRNFPGSNSKKSIRKSEQKIMEW